MDRLLTLSQAARMVGVPRRTLQQYIREGYLSVFEGDIRLSELLKVFPRADADRSGMIEKMDRIKAGAVFKTTNDNRPDPEQLASEVHRLRLQLGETQAVLDSYRQMAAEMKDRLLELQDHCDRKQAVMIGTLVGWFLHQCKLREQR
jgi:CDP-4-dehydro-6-deoxyglucose reductase